MPISLNTSNNMPDQPEFEPPKQANKGLFSRIGTFLSEWISKTPPSAQSIASHDFSIRKSSDSVVRIAEALVQNLEQIKNKLSRKIENPSATSFIIRHIDTAITEAKGVIDDIEKSIHKAEVEYDFIEKALTTISNLHSNYLDEDKFHKNIIIKSLDAAHLAIERDCKMLEYLQDAAIRDIKTVPDNEQLIITVHKAIQPIIAQLEALKEMIPPEKASLEKYFEWRAEIDIQRDELVSLGKRSIDNILNRVGHHLDKNTVETVSTHKVKMTAKELLQMASIEEQLLYLFNNIEYLEADQIEALLFDLRLYADNLEKHGQISIFQKDFRELLQLISKVEELWQDKNNHIH